MAAFTRDTLRKIPMFAALEDSHLDLIASAATVEHRAKHSALFRQGDVGDACYVILDGLVKIHKHSGDGRFKTLAILEPGDCFGEMAVISAEMRSAGASCLEDTELLALHAPEVTRIIESTPPLTLNLLKILSTRLRVADEQIEDLTFKNLPGRVVSELLRLAEQFPASLDGKRMIDYVVTHQEISDLVGTNRETVSKYISCFRRERSLEVRGRKYVLLDEKMLKAWC